MITVPKDIAAPDFLKLNLRANRSVVDRTFTLQAFAPMTTNLVEFFVPNNEVIVLPRNSGIVMTMQAVKYDYKLDGSAGRYNGSVAVNSNLNGSVYTFTALGNEAAAGYNFTLTSTPNTVEIGIDAPFLPNVPNQRYLRFQTRGVAPVDIQWVLKVEILGTQPLV